jgi:DNA end-binding protein Ku
LKYERVCTLDKEIVPWSDVGRAVEVRKDEFVVFTQEELKALRPESNKKIGIDRFVPLDSVDRIYYEKSYILVPDKAADSYNLLLESLKRKGMAGIGRFTLRTKEHPALVYPYRDALVLTTLRYAEEIVDPKAIETLHTLEDVEADELDLAEKIIDNLSGEFDITEYRDTFRDHVEKLVEQKMKGEIITVEQPETEDVKDLMMALRETLAQLQKT